MLIPLLELIIYYNGRLQKNPPRTDIEVHDAFDSTLAYLNLYRQTQEMLNKLGEECNKTLLGMRRRDNVLP